MNLLDQSLGIHEQALQIKARRLEVLAQNIANADTPGYKRVDVTFESALADAVDAELGKRVEIETFGTRRFGAIFGVKSYPARTWARMLDALELPYDITITNSFTPARNNEIEERIKRTARQMRASEDAAETLRRFLS